MMWLLKLYPPRWRRRYGEELSSLVRAQPFSISNTIDMIAGAIDAWIDPQVIPAAQRPAAQGEETMIGIMKFRCAGYGPEVTKADQWRSLAVMLGATAVLTAGWVWLHLRTGDNPYVDSFSLMPFLAAMLFSMPYTYLKGRSKQAQAIFIGGSISMLTFLFGITGWITARM